MSWFRSREEKYRLKVRTKEETLMSQNCCRHFKGKNKAESIYVFFLQGKKNAVDTFKVRTKEETFMSYFP